MAQLFGPMKEKTGRLVNIHDMDARVFNVISNSGLVKFAIFIMDFIKSQFSTYSLHIGNSGRFIQDLAY